MTGLEIAAIAATAAGTATSVAGQVSSANAQKSAADRDLALKNEQASELLARQKINEDILRKQSLEIQSQYRTAFASTGKRGGGLGGVLKIKQDLEQNIAIQRREAEFKARMLRAGGQIENDLASSRQAAAGYGAASSLLTGVSDTYSILKGPTKPSGYK